jgi:hypothetical protein
LIGHIVANAGGFAANIPRRFVFRAHPQRTLVSTYILILGAGDVNQASRTVLKHITSNSMVCGRASL